MLVALEFGRPDVDAFLDELTHEDFEAWAALFEMYPQGWHALRLAAGRIAYTVAQVHSRRTLNERDFLIEMAAASRCDPEALRRARDEAFAVRCRLAAELEVGVPR